VDDGRLRADVLARLRDEPWAQGDADIVDRIAEALHPVVGLRFVATANDADDDTDDTDDRVNAVVAAPLGASKTGGLPHVPAGFEWPTEEGSDEPLSLVCQINLADVARAMPNSLPSAGMLYLFSIADSDRAYGYEIDDTTTAVRYEPATGGLVVATAPERFGSDEYEGAGVLPERLLQVGPSFILQTMEEGDGDDDGPWPAAERFDYDIERAVDRAIEAAGGVPVGVVRMFGDAHLFREEMREGYDPTRASLLLTVDGYALARYAFGEGTFHVLIDRDTLAAGDLTKTGMIFEPGT
jgi:hypothetical protein